MTYDLSKFKPTYGQRVFIAPGAQVVGNITLGDDTSVWFNATLRGELQPVRVGTRTNIQDNSVLHVGGRGACVVGDNCTIGHGVVLHGCTLGNLVLVGMGSIILTDAVIGDNCIIGAGTLILEHVQIPSGKLVVGHPARIIRDIKPKEIEMLKKSAENYVAFKNEYLRMQISE
jgi:carbonic anhydrase/acetyltransferase-like protein (isoleucine patch superfamily)